MTDTSPVSHKMMVACRNANGEPDMFVTNVWVTDAELDEGIHYERAADVAESEGYEGPFIGYDMFDQANIARQVPDLPMPLQVMLSDKADSGQSPVHAYLSLANGEIRLKMKNYNQCESTATGHDVAWVEYYNGSVQLHAYNNINTDDPTHKIVFNDAANDRLGVSADNKPLGLEKALADLEDDDEYQLWEVEVGLFDTADDPNTPFETHLIVVATDAPGAANDMALEFAEENIAVVNSVAFGVTSGASTVQPEDYE